MSTEETLDPSDRLGSLISVVSFERQDLVSELLTEADLETLEHLARKGSRFNGPDRGAWYTAFDLETAQAEIAFHKWIELAEVRWLQEEVTYNDYLADFSAEFHDIRRDKRFADALSSDSYVASQRLAQELLEAGSLGIVYRSVRRRKGTCLACFRPTLVMNVRKGATYMFRWDGKPQPAISVAGE